MDTADFFAVLYVCGEGESLSFWRGGLSGSDVPRMPALLHARARLMGYRRPVNAGEQ